MEQLALDSHLNSKYKMITNGLMQLKCKLKC